MKTEVVPQVVNCPSHQSTAVQEEWSVIKRVFGLAVAFSIRYTKIFLALLDKANSQPVFKVVASRPSVIITR